MSAPPRNPPETPPGKPRPAARRPVAVALKYEFGAQSLPKVVATGKGHVADQILELAFANGVKVREDADLVEVLSAIDIETEIPIEAIAAVAEILAHVYRANGTGPPEPEPPESGPPEPRAPEPARPAPDGPPVDERMPQDPTLQGPTP